MQIMKDSKLFPKKLINVGRMKSDLNSSATLQMF